MKRIPCVLAGLTLLALLWNASLRAQEPVAVEPIIEDGWAWYDATKWPVENKGWLDVERYFARFPGRAKELIPSAVWGLSQHSAGEVVRFRANTDQIKIRYTLLSRCPICLRPASPALIFTPGIPRRKPGAGRLARNRLLVNSTVF